MGLFSIGQTARSSRIKRHRLFDLARMTDVPIVVIFDGPTMSPAGFDPNAGELAGHSSDPRLDVNRRAIPPLIGVICGEVAGWANAVVGECDVVIVPESQVGRIASITSGAIVTSDVVSAIEVASSVLDLLPPAPRATPSSAYRLYRPAGQMRTAMRRTGRSGL